MPVPIPPVPALASRGWGPKLNAIMVALSEDAQSADDVALIAQSIADQKFADVSVDLGDAVTAANVTDGPLTRAAVSEAVAEDAENPETALHDAIVTVAQSITPTGSPYLYEAVTLADARPAAAPGQPVWWLVVDSNPDVTPANMIDGDMVIVRAPQPAFGITVWSDDFARADGPLGTTPVGGLTWALGGTSVAAAVSSGVAKFTAGTAPMTMLVQTSYARTRFEVTMPANNSAGTVAFRYVDVNNRYEINRVSGADPTARLQKIVAGTGTVVKTFTGVSLTGTSHRFIIDDRVLGHLKIYIDSVLVFDETVDTAVSVSALSAEATPSCGGRFITGTSYSSVSWDDAILYRAV